MAAPKRSNDSRAQSSAAKRPVRLFIVEPEGLYRDLLNVALERQAGLQVVGVFADGQAALDAAGDMKPQVAVLDVEPGKSSGIQLGVKLRRVIPDLGIVLLSTARDLNLIASIPNNLLSRWSYLLNKSTHNMTTIARAIHIAAAQLVDLDQNGNDVFPQEQGPLHKLTGRQSEILDLVALGLSNAAIAQKLHLTEKSIENQIGLIYERLDIGRERSAIHPRVKAVLIYLKSKGG